MPRKAAALKKEAPAKSLEAQLWEAANGMRGSVPPSDYMHVALGLVFLRYLSATFETRHAALQNEPHADPEDAEEEGEPFTDKMRRLVTELNAQFAESAKLVAAIRANLRGLGYGF